MISELSNENHNNVHRKITIMYYALNCTNWQKKSTKEDISHQQFIQLISLEVSQMSLFIGNSFKIRHLLKTNHFFYVCVWILLCRCATLIVEHKMEA